MRQLTSEILTAYRMRTFSLLPELRVTTIDDAVAFVNQRGFIFFWPITSIELPNLWMSVAGDRPVADNHDDPAHITWNWKDSLLGGRKWYYAKVLRKKATLISFEQLPNFYALSQNYGAYDEDYITLYEQGRMTMEAKRVYEAILDNGPLDTIELRRLTHLSAPSNEARFNRAISSLQSDFKILPIGVTQSGGWRYAFLYEIVARHYPELPDAARVIQEDKARRNLVIAFAKMLGAIEHRDIQRLFSWRLDEINITVNVLKEHGSLLESPIVAGRKADWLIIPELLEDA